MASMGTGMISKWELLLYLVMIGLLAFTGVTASMLSEVRPDTAPASSSNFQMPVRTDWCRGADHSSTASRLVPANEACNIHAPDSSLFSFDDLP